MDKRQAAAVIDAHRIINEAKSKGIKPRSLAGSRKEVAAHQRSTKVMATRRTPAARKAAANRAEANKLLAAEIAKAKRRIPTAKQRGEYLDKALSATCGSRPTKPPSNGVERKIVARCVPMQFIIEFDKDRTLAEATKTVSKKLGTALTNDKTAWPSLESMLLRPKRHTRFVLTVPMSRSNGAKQRFAIAHAIKERCGAASVQPVEPLEFVSGGGFVDLTTLDPPPDTEWPLKEMRVFEAWDRVPAGNGLRQGAGQIIGHLDSGWYDHPEYDQNRIDVARSHDAVNDRTGRSVAEHSEGNAPGAATSETHGLGTGVLMVSQPADRGTTTVTNMPSGHSEPTGDAVQLTGIAPEATVLPVKCLDSVVVLTDSINIVRGAEYLIEPENPNGPPKVGIISMSFGGLPHDSLQEVLNVGILDKNVIVVGAAGQANAMPIPVVEPAAYPEVIAVAASEPSRWIAHWTAMGPEIDVAAPGQNVWTAGVDLVNGAPSTYVRWGHGTSFACAFTAGVAALWRAFYLDELADPAYDGIPAARIFRRHLRDTVHRPFLWDRLLWGPGIVDVDALLSTPLPAPEDVRAPFPVTPWNPITRISDIVSLGAEAISWGIDVMERAGEVGRDGLFAAQALLNDLVESGGAIVKASVAIGLEIAADTARAGADLIEDAWVDLNRYADAAGDELGRRAAATAAALAQAWEAAEEGWEEAKEEAEEAVDDVVDAVVEVIEDIAEAGGEAAEALIEALWPW